MEECPYKPGQVVQIVAEFYQNTSNPERNAQRFQKITFIEPWKAGPGWCLHFSNGDACHGKYVQPLTHLEKGDTVAKRKTLNAIDVRLVRIEKKFGEVREELISALEDFAAYAGEQAKKARKRKEEPRKKFH